MKRTVKANSKRSLGAKTLQTKRCWRRRKALVRAAAAGAERSNTTHPTSTALHSLTSKEKEGGEKGPGPGEGDEDGPQEGVEGDEGRGEPGLHVPQPLVPAPKVHAAQAIGVALPPYHAPFTHHIQSKREADKVKVGRARVYVSVDGLAAPREPAKQRQRHVHEQEQGDILKWTLLWPVLVVGDRALAPGL